MSEGLKVLELLKSLPKVLSIGCETTMGNFYSQEFGIIERELKKGEKNEKLLNVFKNALTIEHHDYPTIEQHNDSEDVMSYLVKELYTIRQSELEKDMRKALREWVLKNAFPKELKALELIKKCFYVAKSSGAILLTDYGFEHKEELKEVLK